MAKIFNEILKHEYVGQSAYYSIAPKNVYDFFYESGYFRKIPYYQRPYSWQESNINELIDDIYAATIHDKSWFLGPLFTTQQPVADKKISNLLDGQQRITTIQLILLEAFMIVHSFEPALSSDLAHKLGGVSKEIEQTLKKNDQGNWIPIFTPDQSIVDPFLKYFEKVFSVSNISDWKKVHSDILSSTTLNWLTGFKTFQISITTIRKRLSDILTDDEGNPTPDSIDIFCSCIRKLLYDCWVIEIPLQKEEYVLDIFESLNNRGKPLSLTDIIKFKTLTVGKSNQKITSSWSEIFQKIDKLENLEIVKDDDDFFKYLLNTYADDDLTDTKSLVSFFTKEFCDSETNVIRFLDEAQQVCHFVEQLYDLELPGNQFIKCFSNTKDQERFKIIVSVFKFAKKCSDNIRFLLFFYARKSAINSTTISDISQFILDLTKVVVFNSAFLGKKSNALREEILALVYDLRDNKLAFNNFLELRKWSSIDNYTYNYNLVHIKDSDLANLVLIFNQAFTQRADVLFNYSNKQYKKAQSEHLFPVKWTEYWSDCCYTKDDVKNYCDKLMSSTLFVTLSYVSKVDLLEKIKLNLLELDISAPNDRSSSETVIEYVGNKWVLNNSLNNKQKNREFSHKTRVINDYKNGYLMIPTQDDSQLGIDRFTSFTFEEIIERTLIIVDRLVSNYTKSVDSIWK
jgi:uncharacterized protein with ParB-like and HNH nuclease domain